MCCHRRLASLPLGPENAGRDEVGHFSWRPTWCGTKGTESGVYEGSGEPVTVVWGDDNVRRAELMFQMLARKFKKSLKNFRCLLRSLRSH